MAKKRKIMKISNEQKELIINQLSGVIKGEWSNSNGAEQYTTVDGGICKLYNTGTCQFQGKDEPKDQLEKAISIILAGGSLEVVSSEDKQIFIVYGHDTTSREQLELILQKLNLNHSKIVNDSGMTIIEALENKISEIHCGIVLLTTDDLAISKFDYEKKKGSGESFETLLTHRARQNVILELGMLIPVLGRENIIVLKKEGVEVPSDMSGVFYIGFENHIKETVQRMAKRLKNIGFEINADNLLDAME
jgi:predicted nucleotide-binding protein